MLVKMTLVVLALMASLIVMGRTFTVMMKLVMMRTLLVC